MPITRPGTSVRGRLLVSQKSGEAAARIAARADWVGVRPIALQSAVITQSAATPAMTLQMARATAARRSRDHPGRTAPMTTSETFAAAI
jgi:hypothetical protein